jgi:hypothetical protein
MKKVALVLGLLLPLGSLYGCLSRRDDEQSLTRYINSLPVDQYDDAIYQYNQLYEKDGVCRIVFGVGLVLLVIGCIMHEEHYYKKDEYADDYGQQGENRVDSSHGNRLNSRRNHLKG